MLNYNFQTFFAELHIFSRKNMNIIINRIKKITLKAVACRKRIATLAVGWMTDRTTNWAFEYILYPVVIANAGLLKGGAFMIFLSIVTSLAIIKLYDFLKVDWLGIEIIKEIRDGEAKSMLEKVAQWAMKKGDFFALVALSVYSEPIKVTLYMRHGSNKFNGFSRRDWTIFLTSVAISNASWALAVAGGIEIFRRLV